MRIFFHISFFLLTCNAWTQIISYDNELLWEISGNGLNTKSYLYGSLHSNDKRLFRFSDSVYVAMKQADYFVLETDVFSLFEKWDTRKDEVKVLYDNQGNPYTGSSKATRTIYGDEDGMPQFLDAYFLAYCHNAGKKFFELEKVEDQLNMLAEYTTPELQGMSYSPLDFAQEKMIDLYLKGDISGLDRLMRVNMSVFEGMYKDLIVERNKGMLKGIDSVLRKGSLFCAVGAGHLAGEDGLIALLRRKGYKLRKVTAVYREEEFPAKSAVRKQNSFTYKNDSIGLMAIFPGKPMELKIYENHPFLIYREMGQGNTYSIEIVPIDGSVSLEEQAAIYIATPDATRYKRIELDDGSEVYEGISDTYPEGLHWIRLMQNDRFLLILKAYGGNKFMNSNRPKDFFSKVWFE